MQQDALIGLADLQNVTRFRRVDALEIAENDHCALRRRERIDGRLEGRHRFAALEKGLRISPGHAWGQRPHPLDVEALGIDGGLSLVVRVVAEGGDVKGMWALPPSVSGGDPEAL